MHLRPYQEQAVDAVYRYLRERNDNPCVVIPTGGGKTPVMATICGDAVTRWNGRVLVLAHVKELLEQTAGTLRRMAPDLDVGVYSAGLKRRDTDHPVIVAGIQSVYKRACELDRFDLIIVDECFPAGTVVSTPRGDMAIDDLSIGQPVHTALGVGEVEAISARPANKLLELEFDDGRILRCTPNHPFFTEWGWREAQALEVGSRLFSREDVQALRSGDASENLLEPRWRPQGVPVGERVGCPGILFGEVRRTDEAETSFNASDEAVALEVRQDSLRQKSVRMLRKRVPSMDQAGLDGERARLSAREGLAQAAVLLDLLRQEGRECDVDSGSSTAGQPDAQGDWACATRTRRERTAHRSTNTASRKTGVAVAARADSPDGASASFGTPEESQNRHWPLGREDRHRAGRTIASDSCDTRIRQAEGSVLASQRVVRITPVECQSPVAVFNLQISGHPSYYAGGVLAHNCHLLPPDGEGMYRTFLADARIVNPNLRLIGLTATPYRMKSGMLCGPDNLLNDICYEVGVRELIAQGYLCPLRTKAGRRKVDTSGLHVRAGEFVGSEVEELMDTDELVGAACREIVELATDRRAVLIFAASVAHAEHVKTTLERLTGEECGLVTGDTATPDRDRLIARFKGERLATNLFGDTAPALKYLVNVNVLTTGFDAPNVDCVVLLRPTASPGLYYQMVGRGFRLHTDKADCLVLDYGGNILRHGPVDAILITDRAAGGGGEAPAKECPECRAVIHAAYAVCPDCGYQFPPPESGKHGPQASDEGILSGQVIDTEYDVTDVFYSVHQKRGADEDAPRTMLVTYQVGLNDFQSEWVCPEHDGWARQKFEQWWLRRSNDPLPDTAERAVDIAEAGGLAQTHKITVRKVTGDQFDRIVGYELGEKPEPVPLDVALGYDDSDSIPF